MNTYCQRKPKVDISWNMSIVFGLSFNVYEIYYHSHALDKYI